MSITDRFLGIFRVKDEDYDDDYEDDYEENYEDDYEDDYDEPPKRPSRRKARKAASENSFDEEADSDDLEEAAVTKKTAPRKKNTRGGKVVQLNSRTPGSSAEICVVTPKTVAEADEVAHTLLNGKAVVLKLVGLPDGTAQRIVDITYGVTYAIDGDLRNVSGLIFLATPPSFELTGDITDLLKDSSELTTISSGTRKLY